MKRFQPITGFRSENLVPLLGFHNFPSSLYNRKKKSYLMVRTTTLFTNCGSPLSRVSREARVILGSDRVSGTVLGSVQSVLSPLACWHAGVNVNTLADTLRNDVVIYDEMSVLLVHERNVIFGLRLYYAFQTFGASASRCWNREDLLHSVHFCLRT